MQIGIGLSLYVRQVHPGSETAASAVSALTLQDSIDVELVRDLSLSGSVAVSDQTQITNRLMVQVEDGLAISLQGVESSRLTAANSEGLTVADTSLTSRFIGETVTDQVTILPEGVESSRLIVDNYDGLTVSDASLTSRFIGEIVTDQVTILPEGAESSRRIAANSEGMTSTDAPHSTKTTAAWVIDGVVALLTSLVNRLTKGQETGGVTVASNVTTSVLHKTTTVRPLTVHDELIVEMPIPDHVQKQIDKLLEDIATETDPKKLAKLYERLDKLYEKYGL